ncbi:hypothetical protein CDAR_520361 [Caerostris darwini]|uniref:Uncharacterized protein n=1 Tax=Caerostris darwini TaxID=1538125 RepID=A0AAV4W7M3_9ARAC|nr:hypothetical protein CDAR_520361 [Caerostris darwini]
MHTIYFHASFPVWRSTYNILSFRVNCAESKKKKKSMMQVFLPRLGCMFLERVHHFGDRLTSFSSSQSIVLKAAIRRKKIVMQVSLPRPGHASGKSASRREMIESVEGIENPFGIPREIRNQMALWEQDVPRMSQHYIKVSS